MSKQTNVEAIKDYEKPAGHFVAPYLANPTNPVTVTLIGAGGTGSHLLAALGSIHHDLKAFSHPGLQVTVYDADKVTEFNVGRQGFASAEVGLYKSSAIVSRVNRFYGTRWQAVTKKISLNNFTEPYQELNANLIISCVDKAKTRFEIEQIVSSMNSQSSGPQHPYYWIDFGNGRYAGQMILSTVSPIKQPRSKTLELVGQLLPVTKLYAHELKAVDDDAEPSCSLIDSRGQQDLFINRSLVQVGAKLINDLFYKPVIETRGLFINIDTFNVRPIPVQIVSQNKKLSPSPAVNKKRA